MSYASLAEPSVSLFDPATAEAAGRALATALRIVGFAVQSALAASVMWLVLAGPGFVF